VVVKVVIIGNEKIVKETEWSNITVGELVKKLGLMITEYIVLKNNVIVTEDDIVNDGDEIVLYPAKSGG